MGMRGIYDTEGELLGYLDGTHVYTLDGEPTGRIEGATVVNAKGEVIWVLRGDGIYTPDGEPVGYLGGERSETRDPWE